MVSFCCWCFLYFFIIKFRIQNPALNVRDASLICYYAMYRNCYGWVQDVSLFSVYANKASHKMERVVGEKKDLPAFLSSHDLHLILSWNSSFIRSRACHLLPGSLRAYVLYYANVIRWSNCSNCTHIHKKSFLKTWRNQKSVLPVLVIQLVVFI